MVGVAQLAERKNVALEVAGSNPVTHPSKFSLVVDGEMEIAMITKCDRGSFYVLTN